MWLVLVATGSSGSDNILVILLSPRNPTHCIECMADGKERARVPWPSLLWHLTCGFFCTGYPGAESAG